MRWRPFFGKLERPVDPCVHDLAIRWSLPHAGPPRRLQRELRVELRRGTRQRDRLLERGTERIAVEPERVRATDLKPELSPFARLGFERDGAVQQRNCVVDFVPSDSELRRPLRPGDGLCAKTVDLLILSGPGEVYVFRTDGFGVVVGQQSSVIVAPWPGMLDPRGEGGMQLCPLRLRDAVVGNLTCERMLDRVLALARNRRAGAPAHEVAFGENVEVRHAADELVDRPRPEHAP